MEATKLTKAQQACLAMQNLVDEHKAIFIRQMQETVEDMSDLGFDDDDEFPKPKRKLFGRKKVNEKPKE
jgi:hypothetical protein